MTNTDGSTASDASDGIAKLRRFHGDLQKVKTGSTDLTQVEEEIRAALDEVGRELMAAVLAAANVDDLEITVNGVLHSRLHEHRHAA